MTVKKILCAVLTALIAAAALTACADDNLPTEMSTYIAKPHGETTESLTSAEETQIYTLEEMSPVTIDTAVPPDAVLNIDDIEEKSLRAVAEEDMLLDGTSAVNVYGNAKSQYYVLESGEVIAVFLDSEQTIELTACYNSDGEILFMANDEKSWYFTESGSLDYVCYTFSVNGSKISSFYEPDGTRFVIFAANAYYDNNFNILSDNDVITLLKRIGDATELR